MEENERFEEKQEEEEEIWSWGAGTEGQLGTGMLSDEHCPQLLHSLSSFSPISLLACGGAHVVALTSGLFPFYLHPWTPLIFYSSCISWLPKIQFFK